MARLHSETIPTSTLAFTARVVDGFVTTQSDHSGSALVVERSYSEDKALGGRNGDWTNAQLMPRRERRRGAAQNQPMRWSRESNDSKLGLVYYNYRHYNPADGRWISRDIAEDLNNLAVYVSNSSIKTSDSLGLICHETNKDVCGSDVTNWLERTMRNNLWHPLVQTSREHNEWALWIPFFNRGWIGRTLAEFYSLVKTNGPWDYKNSVSFDMPECPSKSQSCKLGVTLCGHCLLKELIGNIHYGWIGMAAGIRSFILLKAADIYQSGGPDEPHDVAAIKIGIDFFERGGNLCNYVRWRLSSLKPTGVRDLKACRPCYARFS